jgi:hypothetical protein
MRPTGPALGAAPGERQYVSLAVVEVLVPTRGALLPDPRLDPVAAVLVMHRADYPMSQDLADQCDDKYTLLIHADPGHPTFDGVGVASAGFGRKYVRGERRELQVFFFFFFF